MFQYSFHDVNVVKSIRNEEISAMAGFTNLSGNEHFFEHQLKTTKISTIISGNLVAVEIP